MPETLRAIVGDGRVTPPVYLRPLVPIMVKYGTTNAQHEKVSKDESGSTKYQLPTFLKEPDVIVILTAVAVVFSLFQALSASMTPMLLEAYPYLTQSTVHGSPSASYHSSLLIRHRSSVCASSLSGLQASSGHSFPVVSSIQSSAG